MIQVLIFQLTSPTEEWYDVANLLIRLTGTITIILAVVAFRHSLRSGRAQLFLQLREKYSSVAKALNNDFPDFENLDFSRAYGSWTENEKNAARAFWINAFNEWCSTVHIYNRPRKNISAVQKPSEPSQGLRRKLLSFTKRFPFTIFRPEYFLWKKFYEHAHASTLLLPALRTAFLELYISETSLGSYKDEYAQVLVNLADDLPQLGFAVSDKQKTELELFQNSIISRRVYEKTNSQISRSTRDIHWPYFRTLLSVKSELQEIVSLKNRLKSYSLDLLQIENNIEAWTVCVLALESASKNNFGVGAFARRRDGNGQEQVFVGGNEVFAPRFDSSAHAEMMVINKIESYPEIDASQFILYTSLEPCPMCLARILTSRIKKVYYVARDTDGGMVEQISNMPKIWSNLAQEKTLMQLDCSDDLRDLAFEIFSLTSILNERLTS